MSHPSSPYASVKEQIGCALHELLPSCIAVRGGKGQWRSLCNRHERLEIRTDATGITGGRCRWEHSSELTVTRVFPWMANRIFDAGFSNLQFEWHDLPSHERPAVSVLLAVGGHDRHRLLEPCLASLLGSAVHVSGGAELVLVQERGTEIDVDWPAIRKVLVEPQPAFNKSLMLNAAAKLARGEVLVIHDADLIVSPTYLTTCLDRCRRAESARPGRLIFYLDEASTQRFVACVNRTAKPTKLAEAGIRPRSLRFDRVVQNTPNPMAIRRNTYFELGGHDEAFQGWGGEDLEFLSRLRTRPIDEFGSEPLIHLWHPPAKKKQSGDRNQQLQDQKLSTPAETRIQRLIEQRHSQQTPQP
ncbi:galactosyltransferase-related protein [Planctomycetes bacterium TBK1r]|uniref:Glycosyltransferase 2-like prokaryotic type domain-containing protein n=1 Tax=Stieleria magnilauensis TaxID=2527963 RepID=A0ABX5XQT8_9BACT|nr:hypothetical protein TBK1r_19290 [Planctomycetes bacterium TBK1r]